MDYDALNLAIKLVCNAQHIAVNVHKTIVTKYQSKELLSQAKNAILNAGWNGVKIVYCGSDAYVYIASSDEASYALDQIVNEDLSKEKKLCSA